MDVLLEKFEAVKQYPITKTNETINAIEIMSLHHCISAVLARIKYFRTQMEIIELSKTTEDELEKR